MLSGAGAALPSAQFAVVPKPTKSAIAPPVGHVPARAEASRATATFPAAAPMEIVPTASGVGRAVVPPAPTASWTRKYWPGWMVPESCVVCHVPAAAEAYWTVHPVTSTAAEPRL